MVDNPTNRREAVRGVLAEMGWDLVEAYFSTTRGGGVLLIKGDPEKTFLAEMVMMASGGFTSVENETLITADEMLAYQKEAGRLTDRYDAPNRDEIDRILLDERPPATN